MNYTEKAAKYVCYFAYGTAIYLFFKYGFPAILPFLISFVAATLAEKAALRLQKKTGISKRVYCALILIVIIATILTALTAALGRLIFEAREFAEEYIKDTERMEKLLSGFNGISEMLTQRLNISGAAKRNVTALMDSTVSKLAEMLMSWISSVIEKTASAILTGIPSWILFITVTVITTFYLGCRKQGSNSLLSLLTTEQKKSVVKIKSGVALTVAKYIKAYSLLLSVTATVLLIGLSILKIKYALIIALLVAALDLLPVIGIGTVLIPWGVISIAKGEHGVGFGLFAVFAVAIVIREVAESRIIGKCLGADPIITLFAMYTGLKLFGFGGLLLMPMLVSGVIAYYSEKNKTAYVKKRTIAKGE